MLKKHRYLLGIIASVLAFALSFGVGITLANFQTAERINQQVGYQGELDHTSIFFNGNIWDVDDALFYMYRFNSTTESNGATGVFVSPKKNITPLIDGVSFDMSVFEYDPTVEDTHGDVCDKFLFYRLDPKVAGINYLTDASEDYYIKRFAATPEDFDLYCHKTDTNHYIARHVELKANDTLKGIVKAKYDLDTSDPDAYLSNVNNGGSSLFTIDGSGNIKITSDGTYTIDLYISAANDNHIVLTDESFLGNFAWNQTSNITYDAGVNYYCINGWGMSSFETNQLITKYNGSKDLAFTGATPIIYTKITPWITLKANYYPYLYIWRSANNSEHMLIRPTKVSGFSLENGNNAFQLQCYSFNCAYYDRFLLVYSNNASATVDNVFDTSFYKTADITYSSSYNFYEITVAGQDIKANPSGTKASEIHSKLTLSPAGYLA